MLTEPRGYPCQNVNFLVPPTNPGIIILIRVESILKARLLILSNVNLTLVISITSRKDTIHFKVKPDFHNITI